MITITDKTIAFTVDGALIIFDNRAEFMEWTEGKENYEVWAEPKWLFNTLREQERVIGKQAKIIEEGYGENEIRTLDSISQFNGMRREAEREQEGSENSLRAVKIREDVGQRKIWGRLKDDICR